MNQSPPDASSLLLAGRYRLGGLLGRGGMADVYAAVDERDGCRVAVKLFRQPLPGVGGGVGDCGVRDGEVRTLAGLRHPGLVELLDVGEDAGRSFCVMTLVDGPTLAEHLTANAMDVEAVARLGAGVAGALAYVHGCGVMHRDVKPANVLLDVDGRPRLADFGIARLVDATRVTSSSLVVGTAGYLAPEQVVGGRIGPPVDLYALGLVLLECLTGRREYDGPAVEAALARLHRRPQLPEHLPSGWVRLLDALTADDPAHRPGAAAAATALSVLVKQPDAQAGVLGLAAAAPQRVVAVTEVAGAADRRSPAVPTPPARGRRRAALAGGLLAPLVALVVPGVLANGSAAPVSAPAPAPAPVPADRPGPLAGDAGAQGPNASGGATVSVGPAAPGLAAGTLGPTQQQPDHTADALQPAQARDARAEPVRQPTALSDPALRGGSPPSTGLKSASRQATSQPSRSGSTASGRTRSGSEPARTAAPGRARTGDRSGSAVSDRAGSTASERTRSGSEPARTAAPGRARTGDRSGSAANGKPGSGNSGSGPGNSGSNSNRSGTDSDDDADDRSDRRSGKPSPDDESGSDED